MNFEFYEVLYHSKIYSCADNANGHNNSLKFAITNAEVADMFKTITFCIFFEKKPKDDDRSFGTNEGVRSH